MSNSWKMYHFYVVCAAAWKLNMLKCQMLLSEMILKK